MLIKEFSIKRPKVIKNRDHGILIGGYGVDSGEAKTLDTVAKLLKIKESERENCIVLKTSSPIVRRYTSKGWRCYRNYSLSFCDTLKAVIEDLENQKRKSQRTTSEISDPSRFSLESTPLTKENASKHLRTETEIESATKTPSVDNENDLIAFQKQPALIEGFDNEDKKERMTKVSKMKSDYSSKIVISKEHPDDQIKKEFEDISAVELNKDIMSENSFSGAIILRNELPKNEQFTEEEQKNLTSTSIDSFYASPSWNYPIIRRDNDFESTEKPTTADSSLSSGIFKERTTESEWLGKSYLSRSIEQSQAIACRKEDS